MQIKELLTYLENIAPLTNQEHYDNSGMICGDENADLSGVLLCIDSTEEHIEEAISKNCNLIIAHHPLIFGGIKKLTPDHFVGRTLIKAIRNNVAIYAMHTNLDNLLYNGVSEKIARKIGLTNITLLSPKMSLTTEEIPVGAGIIGTCIAPTPEREFLLRLKKAMQAECIRYTGFSGKMIEKVAVCGGSGAFLLPAAMQSGADAFVSADFKYHDFFEADRKILIADIGHFESEQYTVEIIYDLITKRFSNFAAHLTELNSNPINYL